MCFATGCVCTTDLTCFVCMQRLVADDVKGKGRQEIVIDATQRDLRMEHDANYYTHTDATRQFQQARPGDGNRFVNHDKFGLAHLSAADNNICMLCICALTTKGVLACCASAY